MDTWQESRCPVCRHSYYHLPSISWLLHFLLLKLYPKAYQRRKSQIMEEEKTHGTFSTQFERYIALSRSSEHDKDRSVTGSLESAPSDKNSNTNDEITKNLTVEGCNNQVAVSDVLCRICEELLYRLVVLNCGHVFCEVCILGFSNDEQCRCPVCQSIHPNGFPRVCLVLEGFLEQHVSKEYAAKRVAIDELIRTCEHEITSTGSTQVPHGGQCSPVPMDEHVCSSGHKVHFGVG